MTRMKTFATLACALLLASGCGGGGGGGGASGSPAPAVAAGSVTTFSIVSSNAANTYPISVYVPQTSSPTQLLPVIYALDAETRFDTLRGYMQQAGTQAILVGIANTGEDRRQIDFLMPGAVPYYRFLVEELLPVVESRYRADPARRILSGLSSGGLFVGYALFMEAPSNHKFSAFISADGSFWQQPVDVSAAEAGMYTANLGHDIPVTVLLGGDSNGNLIYVEGIYALLLQRNYPGMRLSLNTYSVGHVQMDAPFFEAAIAVLFGPQGRG
jgi:predicted alpha/beta superfamily hydrolase